MQQTANAIALKQYAEKLLKLAERKPRSKQVRQIVGILRPVDFLFVRAGAAK